MNYPGRDGWYLDENDIVITKPSMRLVVPSVEERDSSSLEVTILSQEDNERASIIFGHKVDTDGYLVLTMQLPQVEENEELVIPTLEIPLRLADRLALAIENDSLEDPFTSATNFDRSEDPRKPKPFRYPLIQPKLIRRTQV